MTIQLADKRLKARISPASRGHYRLVIEFPLEPKYERIVKTAFGELLQTHCPLTEDPQDDERRSNA